MSALSKQDIDRLVEATREAYCEVGGDDGPWKALSDARDRLLEAGTDVVERAMIELARDPRWEARAAVPTVLRYLVGPNGNDGTRPIPRALERACLLVGMAQTETDARVLRAIVSAFVDLKNDVGDVLAAGLVCRFVGHPDADVRYAVASALSGIETTDAIAALVRLSRDPDGHVRDWACFGLGHQIVADTDEIREALAARLDDPNGEASEEAATGLALRGDARGVERVLALLARFDEEGVTERVLMTASEAPDARYVPALEAIAEESPELRAAVNALAACRAARPRPTCISPRHIGCACMRPLIPGLDGKR